MNLKKGSSLFGPFLSCFYNSFSFLQGAPSWPYDDSEFVKAGVLILTRFTFLLFKKLQLPPDSLHFLFLCPVAPVGSALPLWINICRLSFKGTKSWAWYHLPISNIHQHRTSIMERDSRYSNALDHLLLQVPVVYRTKYTRNTPSSFKGRGSLCR